MERRKSQEIKLLQEGTRTPVLHGNPALGPGALAAGGAEELEGRAEIWWQMKRVFSEAHYEKRVPSATDKTATNS